MTLFIKYGIIFYLAAFISGILLKTYLNPPTFITLIVFTFCLFLILKKTQFSFIVLIPIGIFLTSNYGPDINLEHLIGKKVQITGVIKRIPEVRENSTRLFIEAKEIKLGEKEFQVDENLILYLNDTARRLNYGDQILLKNTRFEKIKNFKNPGSFDLNNFYKRKNIHYSAFVNYKNLTKTGKYSSVNPFLYRINFFRTEYINFVRSSIPYPQSEIINALSVGEKSYFPSRLRERFSALGLSHIFAISGLHIGFVAIVFYFMIKWLLKRSEYLLLKYQVPKIAAFLSIVPVIFYVVLTGFSISSIRASIMVAVFLIAIIMDREEYKVHSLCLAAFIILIFNPASLFDLSFQLSFLSVLGIIILHRFYPLKISSLKDKIISAGKTTIAATFITLPLTVNSFGYLPVFSVPANLTMLPIVEFLIVPLCLISVLTFKFSVQITDFILNLDTFFINIMLRITQSFEDLGMIYITVPKFDSTSVILLYLLGVLILFQKNHQNIKYFIPPVLILITVFNAVDFNKLNNQNLKAHFLDSGNKNIALIELPNSKKILINGGFSLFSESDFIERSVLIPFLLHKKITSLDLAIYTSLDKSHLKGLNTLTNRIKIDELWINGSKLNNSVWDNVYKRDIEIQRIEYLKNNYSSGITELVVYGKTDKADIYDSKLPKPVLCFINFNEKTIVLGESVEQFSLEELILIKNSNNRKIDLVFLPETKNEMKFKRIINAFKPKTVICKNCLNKLDYIANEIIIYDVLSLGMITVEIDSKDIVIREYLL
ncbi:MAG: DNA internalization-related competence protein ComEC/Rec2 [Thermodesulfobacteriota bacterium]